jgi:methyl-accepting chemotaxis protein
VISGERLETGAEEAFVHKNAAVDLRVLKQLNESNARIGRLIRDIQSLTEREILACGGVLSAIVDTASHLAHESERSLASSIAHSEEMTARFVQGMRADILAQESAVQRILKLASGIEAAITAINDLTLSSKVLAINARIESARLGEQGKAFAVIADSLGGLSSVIHGASDTVSASIDAVRKGIPQMSASAVSMHERTNLFVEEVAEQVKSASLETGGQSSGSLAKLMELSNQALSHLQFQDPMAQKLLSINGDLELVKERVRQVLGGVDQLDAADIGEVARGSEPPPGEIVLF